MLLFGKVIPSITTALKYTAGVLEKFSQPLSIHNILNFDFSEKIRLLYDSLYDILSENYGDGESLTVSFHKDSPSGLHPESLLKDVLESRYLDMFKDELRGTSLTITIQKDGNNIVNKAELRRFVAEVIYYMVKYNSIAFIKEGLKFSHDNYGLFISLREMFHSDYITGLTSGSFSDSVHLSNRGLQVFNEWSGKWNHEMDDEFEFLSDKEVWGFEDCWPFYLFDTDNDLRNWFNYQFLIDLL